MSHRHTTGKFSQPILKNRRRWIGFIPVAIFVVFLGYEFISQMPEAKQAQAQINTEFTAIEPLQNANVVDYQESHGTKAFTSSTYITNANSDEIFKHYDKQLQQRGWQSYGIKGLTSWGKDLGGQAAIYCKGNEKAEIQYAGQGANYGWTYAFSISWDAEDCATAIKGGWVKQTVPVSLFFTAFGIIFVFYGYNTARIAWTKDAREYREWLHKMRGSKKSFWSSILPASYSVWNDRILSLIGIAFGLFAIWVGAYSLWRNIFGG